MGSSLVLVFNTAGGISDRLLTLPAGQGGAVGSNPTLADENASSGAVSWLLPDNLGTIRDVAQFNSGTGLTSIVDHLKFDSFGNITAQSNSANQPLFAFTGMLLNSETGIYFDHARWYDPHTGRFISQDPTGFRAGDSNLYRYVDNGPTDFVDLTGRSPSRLNGPPIPPSGFPGIGGPRLTGPYPPPPPSPFVPPPWVNQPSPPDPGPKPVDPGDPPQPPNAPPVGLKRWLKGWEVKPGIEAENPRPGEDPPGDAGEKWWKKSLKDLAALFKLTLEITRRSRGEMIKEEADRDRAWREYWWQKRQYEAELREWYQRLWQEQLRYRIEMYIWKMENSKPWN